MKYSNNFIRDFNWYLSVRHLFSFDGRTERGIIFDVNGIDGRKAFYYFDSTGIIKPTRHPNIFKSLLKTKGSVNLHIKMYSEDSSKGLLMKHELLNMCKEWNSPDWFFEAIEKAKYKLCV